MDRKYTAQEMRDYADAIAGDLGDNEHGCVEYSFDDLIPVVEALRQAADAMDREKKYEFSVKEFGGYVQPLHEDSVSLSFLDGRAMGDENYVIVRREVGEWEEVG